MNRFPPRPRPFGSRHRWAWWSYHLAVVLIYAVSFCAWAVVLTPNTSRPPRPLGVQTAYAWGWVWINTRSGIYRHPTARWWGNTREGKYRPEWLARVEGDRETRNGQ